MKKFSAESIISLKEALTHIYWKRKDIKTFIYHAIENKVIITTIDWENSTKEESISVLIDRMTQRYDIYRNDLLALFDAVLHFNHLGSIPRPLGRFNWGCGGFVPPCTQILQG